MLSGKSNHRVITKDKSSVSNKLDFNNICGMMRSSTSKSKETNVNENIHRIGRLKPAKNVYYIEERKDDEPSIFIIDPATINKHKKFHQVRKSLEDVRIHKLNNNNSTQVGHAYDSECDANIGWNFMDRNYYGSRTLPRDFSRRNIRPGLNEFLNNIQQQNSSEVERSDTFAYNQPDNNNLFPPPPLGFAFQHSSSFDELSSAKSNRDFFHPNGNININVEHQKAPYQWPKVIPKSPSSFSMNSFRLQRQPPPFSKCPQNYNQIDEFDLDKIENDFRQSHSTLLKENVTDFGTAV